MDEYLKFKSDEYGFYNGVEFSIYAVQVQNAVHVMLIADNGKPKNHQNIGMLTGSAYCHAGDEFDFDYGVKLAVSRAIKKDFPMIWKSFRRAQWHKLHDVTDEQMMITHWMPIENVTKQDNGGWISVEERLPEFEKGDYIRGSIDVEAKDAEGNIYPCAWCVVDKEDSQYRTWYKPIEDDTINGESKKIDNIISWRPMRGDK